MTGVQTCALPISRILGSEQATTWTETVSGSHIWQSDSTFTDPYSVGTYGAEIFFENTDGSVSWGVHKSGTTSLVAEYDWTWNANNIYVYSITNPNSEYTSVEMPQRQFIINLNDKDYLHIDGIDLFYVGESAITYKTYPMPAQVGLIIENLEIGYVSVKNSEAGYGIDAGGYSNMTVRHCDIHDTGRRGISFHIYGGGGSYPKYTIENVLIEDNYFHNGYHTTGVDFSVGESGYRTASFDGVIVRRNLFYDPPTSTGNAEQVFIQNYRYADLGASINNLYIYSNIFISPPHLNSIKTEGAQSVYIYNNVFYNHNPSGSISEIGRAHV